MIDIVVNFEKRSTFSAKQITHYVNLSVPEESYSNTTLPCNR